MSRNRLYVVPQSLLDELTEAEQGQLSPHLVVSHGPVIGCPDFTSRSGFSSRSPLGTNEVVFPSQYGRLILIGCRDRYWINRTILSITHPTVQAWRKSTDYPATLRQEAA